MKVTVFTAADYVDSSAGKLTIIGAFDNIEIENCPTTFKPFGVAIKIIAEPRDRGKMRQGRIVLRKVGAKKPLFEGRLGMNFEMAAREKVNTIILALNIIGVRFESLGGYELILLVGSRVRTSTRLNVVKRAAPHPPTERTKRPPTGPKKP